MAKRRRKRTVESLDEYMSEEHIGQESNGQSVAGPEDQPTARGDPIDSDGDIEVNIQSN